MNAPQCNNRAGTEAPRSDLYTSKQTLNSMQRGTGIQCRTLRRSGVTWSNFILNQLMKYIYANKHADNRAYRTCALTLDKVDYEHLLRAAGWVPIFKITGALVAWNNIHASIGSRTGTLPSPPSYSTDKSSRLPRALPENLLGPASVYKLELCWSQKEIPRTDRVAVR